MLFGDGRECQLVWELREQPGGLLAGKGEEGREGSEAGDPGRKTGAAPGFELGSDMVMALFS